MQGVEMGSSPDTAVLPPSFLWIHFVKFPLPASHTPRAAGVLGCRERGVPRLKLKPPRAFYSHTYLQMRSGRWFTGRHRGSVAPSALRMH